MLFSELYKFANGLTGDFVSVEELKKFIIQKHPEIEKVNFWPVELDPNISLGHMIYERERSSPYDAPFKVASIRFERKQNRCWARFICCKELMHVFDNAPQSVTSREKFLQLMGELQNRPLEADMSEMFKSELNAEWMALVVLCPERLREALRPRWEKKELVDYDVALQLRIPEIFVRGLMGPSYQLAKNALTKT